MLTNSLANMSNKRPLTPEEIAMADRMRAIMETTPGLTQESVAAAVGVTQGQVWQWLEGRMPVSAKRAASLASALGIHNPAEISVAYREIAPTNGATHQSRSHRLTTNESQPERFDPDILAATHRAMRELHAEEGLAYNLEDDPVHFLLAYKLHEGVARLNPEGADLVRMFRAAELINGQGADDGRAGNGKTGLPDEGTDPGKMAGKVQQKKGRT